MMKKPITVFCVVLLVGIFALSLGADSQAGGLPAVAARVTKLEAQMVTVISQIVSLTKDVTGLKIDVAGLKAAVVVLQKEVIGLKVDVAGLKTDVAGLKTAVGTLNTKVSALTDSVVNLKAQNNWAVVNSSGNVVRSKGVGTVSAVKSGTGTYQVTFGSDDITGCAYIATIGDVGKASATPGFITVSGGIANTLTDVQVQTYDKTGTAVDSPFHLYVSCP